MEELFELRACLEQGRYADAMVLLGEMEEMSKDDKINKVRTFAIILLLHLIKKDVQKRTTRSWDLSIRNSVRGINQVNKRRKAGGVYLNESDVKEIIREAYPAALDNAAVEAFEGLYSEAELSRMANEDRIKTDALQLILKGQEGVQ